MTLARLVLRRHPQPTHLRASRAWLGASLSPPFENDNNTKKASQRDLELAALGFQLCSVSTGGGSLYHGFCEDKTPSGMRISSVTYCTFGANQVRERGRGRV